MAQDRVGDRIDQHTLEMEELLAENQRALKDARKMVEAELVQVGESFDKLYAGNPEPADLRTALGHLARAVHQLSRCHDAHRSIAVHTMQELHRRQAKFAAVLRGPSDA